nr:Chain 1, Midi peptide designed based on m-conotoxins [unidentified]
CNCSRWARDHSRCC